MTNEQLATLDRAATQGTLIACGWGDGSTQMGMTNIFNEDVEVLVMECIPEADANFIVALWNAYRAGYLAVIGPDAVEQARATAAETALKATAEAAATHLKAKMAAEARLKEWQDCAMYDATMEGLVFKGWNRSALDRCRKAALEEKSQ